MMNGTVYKNHIKRQKFIFFCYKFLYPIYPGPNIPFYNKNYHNANLLNQRQKEKFKKVKLIYI